MTTIHTSKGQHEEILRYKDCIVRLENTITDLERLDSGLAVEAANLADSLVREMGDYVARLIVDQGVDLDYGQD